MLVIFFLFIFIFIVYVLNVWGFYWLKDIEIFLMIFYSYLMGILVFFVGGIIVKVLMDLMNCDLFVIN